MSRWTLTIPGWHPRRLNELLGHRMKAARLKKADCNVIGRHLVIYGVAPAVGKRRVTLTIVLGKGRRGGDPDAYWKSLLDALVRNTALLNDTRQTVELAPVNFERGEKATIIELEDVDK